MRTLTIIALVLIVIGAINWGLIGFFRFNLVNAIFGMGPIGVFIERLIYAVVGLAGLYGIRIIRRLVASRDDICVPGHVTPIAQT